MSEPGEMDHAGGVERFLRAAGRESGEQKGVLVAAPHQRPGAIRPAAHRPGNSRLTSRPALPISGTARPLGASRSIRTASTSMTLTAMPVLIDDPALVQEAEHLVNGPAIFANGKRLERGRCLPDPPHDPFGDLGRPAR